MQFSDAFPVESIAMKKTLIQNTKLKQNKAVILMGEISFVNIVQSLTTTTTTKSSKLF